jgi:hypothetical protein
MSKYQDGIPALLMYKLEVIMHNSIAQFHNAVYETGSLKYPNPLEDTVIILNTILIETKND